MQRTPIVEEDIRFVLSACCNELLILSGKTLLLTGGSGFVGSYLVESIIAFNHEHEGAPCRLLLPTRSLTATRAKWPHFFGVPNLIWFEWDGRTLNAPDVECDYVIHTASPADPANFMHAPMQTMEDIANGVSAVLHYARSTQVRSMLYLSSGAAYGRQQQDMPALQENMLCSPDLSEASSCYGEAKRYAELLCRVSGVPCVIARLFAFVGPWQDSESSFAVPDFIRQAMLKQEIRIHSDGLALRTYCYISDLTVGLLKLLMRATPGELFNVGSDTPQVSIRELANSIAEIVGNTKVVVEGQSNDGSRSRYIPDTAKFRQIHTPQIGLAVALNRTITSIQHTMNTV